MCKSYNSQNGNCLECYTGYELSLERCVLALNNNYPDELCRSWSNGKCQHCSERAYFVNGICTSADPLCKTFNSVNGFCQTCYNGYTLTDNKCILDLNNTFFDTLCRVWSNGVCTECSQRAYFASGVCKEVHPLCNTFDLEGVCLSCFSGYALESGQCILAPQIVNTNIANLCLRAENNSCTLCANRAYLSDSNCI